MKWAKIFARINQTTTKNETKLFNVDDNNHFPIYMDTHTERERDDNQPSANQ